MDRLYANVGLNGFGENTQNLRERALSDRSTRPLAPMQGELANRPATPIIIPESM